MDDNTQFGQPPASNWPPPAPSLPIASRYVPPIPTAYPRRAPVKPTVVAPPPPVLVRPVRESSYRSDWDDEYYDDASFRRRVAKRLPSVAPLMITMAIFAGMMCVSFGQGLFGMVSEPDSLAATDSEIRSKLIDQTIVFEALDTMLVLIGIVIAGRPLARAAAGSIPITWALAAPAFLFLLGFNLAYHMVLQGLLQMMVSADTHAPAPSPVDIDLIHTAFWAMLLTCVQPAVVEELFFRYLLLGHLRSHLGIHASVWLSAVVFGMAHLGNIPGWPVLIVLGAGLGYARVYSGGLALPILLHFLHNFAVLLIDAVAK